MVTAEGLEFVSENGKFIFTYIITVLNNIIVAKRRQFLESVISNIMRPNILINWYSNKHY